MPIFLSEKLLLAPTLLTKPDHPPRPNAGAARDGRSHPLYPHCFAKGVPGEAAPYVFTNSTHAMLARPQPQRTRTGARPPQSPPPPMLAQRGFRGPAACVCGNSTSPPLRAIRYASRNPTTAGPPTRSRFAPSNTPWQFGRPRSSQRARPPSTLSLSRWLLPLVARRTPHRFATTNARRETNASRTTNAPDRFVRARLRCSSRASLPLTPQAGTPTATIGMRPATSLRERQSQLMDSFGPSGVVGSPTRPPLPASQPLCRCSLKKRCERASTE